MSNTKQAVASRADAPKPKRYRVLGLPMCYNDNLAPQRKGAVYAQKGDIVVFEEIYPELAKYPQYIQLYLDMGAIEEVPEPQIVSRADQEASE